MVIVLAMVVLVKYLSQLYKDRSAKFNSAVTSFRLILVLLSFNAVMAKLPDWLYLISFGTVDPLWSQTFLTVKRSADSLAQFTWMAMATIIIASAPQIIYALKHPMITGTFNFQAQKSSMKEMAFFIIFITIFSALAAVAKYYEFALAAH